MEHEQIDKYNLIDRYLMGKLLAEESARFEEHLVDCQQCIAQLQTTKNFVQDLRFIAAEQASQIGRHQPERSFLQMLFGNRLVLAMICLLIAAAVGAFFILDYTQRLRAEANQAESLSKQWEQSYESERQAAEAADMKRQEAELQRAELEARLKDAEAQSSIATAKFGQSMPAEGPLSLFALTSVNRSQPRASKAINQISIPRSATMVSFSMSLEVEQQFDNYHITIFDSQHRIVFKSSSSTPDRALNSLSIFFKPGRFQPGDYSLIVKGVKNGGGSEDVGNYPFSIIPPH